MKYYEINKRISYAIIAFSSAILVLWITNVTLHYTKTQWTDINLNLWFVTAVSSCGYTYPLSSSSSFPIQSSSLSVGSTITTTNLIYTQYIVGYHSIYQKINICFLFMLGGWMLIVLLMSIFLLLKSRYPYKQACYLSSQKSLKINLNIFSFLGLISGIVYWGYIVNFYINLQNTTCTYLIIYAQSYQIQVILGGIILLFCCCIYFMTIGVKLDFYRDKTLSRPQQQTKQNLITLQVNDEAQKIISQRLAALPRINQLKHIEMKEYKPPTDFMISQFDDKRYISNSQQGIRAIDYQNQINQQVSHQFNRLTTNNTTTPRTPPKKLSALQQDIAQRYDDFGRIRKFHPQPVVIEQVQLQMDDKILLLKQKQQQRKIKQSKLMKIDTPTNTNTNMNTNMNMNMNKQVEKQQRILDELYKDQPVVYRNYPTPGKKPRLKLFKNRDTSPISQLKRQYGYN